jgi:hypothetical protein
MVLEGALYVQDVLAEEEEAPRRKIPLGTLDVANNATRCDCNNRAMRQAQRGHRLRSRHVRSEFCIACCHPLVQRLSFDAAFCPAPSSPNLQKDGIELTIATSSTMRAPVTRAIRSASLAVTQCEFRRTAAEKYRCCPRMKPFQSSITNFSNAS